MIRAGRLLLLAGLLLGGCDDGGGDVSPCRSDPKRCRDDQTFAIDQTCQRTDALTVALGADEAAPFTALPEGTLPALHEGRQGGRHLFASVQLGGLEATEAQRVKLEFDLRDACEAPDCFPLAQRTLVVGDAELPLEIVGDRAELFALVLFVDYDGGGPYTYTVNATDACGRKGAATLVADRLAYE